ncbi:hypothetical protein DICPUDRAFT_85191, partial [Dictyostelium purpureum]
SPKRLSRTFSTVNNNNNSNISERVKFFQQKDEEVKQQSSPISSSRHSRKLSVNSDSDSGSNSGSFNKSFSSQKPLINSNLNKPIQQPHKPIPQTINKNIPQQNENFQTNGPKRSSRPLPTPPISRSTSVESNLSNMSTTSGPKEMPPPPPPIVNETQNETNVYNNNSNQQESQQQPINVQQQVEYSDNNYLHKDDFSNEDYNQQQICIENLTMTNYDGNDQQYQESIDGSNDYSQANYQEFENIDFKSFKKRPMDLDTETVLNAIEALEEYHRSPNPEEYEDYENDNENGDLIDVSLLNDVNSANTTATNTNGNCSSRSSIESNHSTSTSASASSASQINHSQNKIPISASSSSSSSSLTSSNNKPPTQPRSHPVANSQGTYIHRSTSSTSSISSTSSDNEATQKKILDEILSTEEDYLRDLDFIINDMVEPLSLKGIDKPTLMGVFSNIEIIRNVSKTIVDDLKSNTLNLHNFILVFKKMSAFFKMYSQYCTHHPKSIQNINDLVKNNSTFSQFKNEIASNPNSRGLSLLDYLIKPIQRICKYPLLFNELIRTTLKDDKDYEILQEVHGKLVEVAEFVNQCQHTKENNDRLLEIQNMIEGAPFTILESTRKILKESWVRIKEGKSDDSHSRYVLLFNDNIMFTKNSSFTKKYQFSFCLPYHSTKIQTSVKPLSLLLSGTNSDNINISIEMIFQEQQEKDEVYQLLLDLIEKGKRTLETLKSRSSVLIPKNLSANTSPILKSTVSSNNIKSGGSLGKSSGSNILTSPPFISKLNQQQQQNQSHQALVNLSKIMMEEDAKKRRTVLNPIGDKNNNLK